MGPIYTPKGAAKEYGDYALNIYSGCPHRCSYCLAPNVLHKTKEAFHSVVEPRAEIVEKVRKQIEKEKITNKLIHLCFVCDPYPTGFDTKPTREIIKLLKESGNHVQLLTKSKCVRDLDLLDSDDWYGISLSGSDEAEPNAASHIERIEALKLAKTFGVSTWVSFEPVVDADAVMNLIKEYHDYFDIVKIGKLNYHPSDINWGKFAVEVSELCESLDLKYKLKNSLLEEKEKYIAE